MSEWKFDSSGTLLNPPDWMHAARLRYIHPREIGLCAKMLHMLVRPMGERLPKDICQLLAEWLVRDPVTIYVIASMCGVIRCTDDTILRGILRLDSPELFQRTRPWDVGMVVEMDSVGALPTADVYEWVMKNDIRCRSKILRKFISSGLVINSGLMMQSLCACGDRELIESAFGNTNVAYAKYLSPEISTSLGIDTGKIDARNLIDAHVDLLDARVNELVGRCGERDKLFLLCRGVKYARVAGLPLSSWNAKKAIIDTPGDMSEVMQFTADAGWDWDAEFSNVHMTSHMHPNTLTWLYVHGLKSGGDLIQYRMQSKCGIVIAIGSEYNDDMYRWVVNEAPGAVCHQYHRGYCDWMRRNGRELQNFDKMDKGNFVDIVPHMIQYDNPLWVESAISQQFVYYALTYTPAPVRCIRRMVLRGMIRDVFADLLRVHKNPAIRDLARYL